MKNKLTFLIVTFVCMQTFAQDYNPLRYRESIFSEVLTIADVNYGEAPQWVWPYWNVDLNLDVYMPDGDDNPKRPLIIFAHAGGFINGGKDVDNMVAICDSFARLGYVTASIDYRKGFDPIDAESCERAVYRAVQDGKAAVRYFKENASLYDIDTNYVFFGGMSAGGFISMHVGYMDKETDRPASTYGGGLVNDLECLDCAGNSYDHGSNVRAVLDFWGGVADTTLFESGEVPMLLMHGEYDPVVPFVYGHPFGLFTLPESYGAQPISERLDHQGVYYELFTSEGPLHMLDGSDNGTFTEEPNSFWSDTLLPESIRFLYENIKPNTFKLSPDSTVLCFGDSLDFLVSDAETSHYIWDYNLDEIVTVTEDNSAEARLAFNSSGVYDIMVVEFNEILCAGDTMVFHVQVLEELVPVFSYSIEDANIVNFNNESSGAETYFWDFGDGMYSEDMNPVHSYAENGTYDVSLTITNALGCEEVFTTSISIIELNTNQYSMSQFLCYPNPFNNQLNIQIPFKNATVEVRDVTGKRISITESSNEIEIIDTESWSSGVYFVTAKDTQGNFLVQKVAKK